MDNPVPDSRSSLDHFKLTVSFGVAVSSSVKWIFSKDPASSVIPYFNKSASLNRSLEGNHCSFWNK